MAAISTKGLNIWMTKGGVAATSLTITAVSTAKPAVLSTAATTGVTAGDLALVKGTNHAELDSKLFVVGTVAAGTITLVGSDTTGSTATLGATPTVEIFKRSDMVKLCLSAIEMSSTEGGSVSVGTFCSPSATLATPASSAGTVSLSGYVSVTDPDYSELILAESDSKQRYIEIELPQSNGSICFGLTLSSVSWSLPLEGGISYQFSGTLSDKPVHRW